MGYGVTAWPCGGEERMGRKPPLIPNKYRKPLPTISPSNLFFSGLVPAHPLQMIPLLTHGAFGKGRNGIRKKSRWPSFFPL